MHNSFSLKISPLGLVAKASDPRYFGDRLEELKFKASLDNLARSYLKIKSNRGLGRELIGRAVAWHARGSRFKV